MGSLILPALIVVTQPQVSGARACVRRNCRRHCISYILIQRVTASGGHRFDIAPATSSLLAHMFANMRVAHRGSSCSLACMHDDDDDDEPK